MRQRESLEDQLIHCESCPRLRKHCLAVAREKRLAFRDEQYWGRPVPPFGPTNARLVIVGLAPGAHGANRTGRIFTGDRSGEWLYRALHRAGFASQAHSTSRDDGMKLKDAVISCVVKCAPPQNKPTPLEQKKCMSLYLGNELQLFSAARIYIALGSVAWNSLWTLLGQPSPRAGFAHGKEVNLKPLETWETPRILLGSYHPSQQNTFTGRLTEPMFDQVFSRAREILN
ncbi:uracil-DNA glycosylase [bacterium]|nr:uracil-DNA glycosylase [bacterium]